MEITAKEIERQATQIDLQSENFVMTCGRVADDLIHIAMIVSSEDSELCKTLTNYAETYNNIAAVAKQKFENLSIIMHTFANNTISNEESTQSVINNYNSALDDINSLIASINQ